MNALMEIWHNKRCSKSRNAIQLLEEKNVQYDVFYYLDTPPDEQQIRAVVEKLGIKAEDLIRRGEKEFKEHFKGRKLSENEWIEAMAKFPKLIERPILIKGDKAAIGRPTENLLDLL